MTVSILPVQWCRTQGTWSSSYIRLSCHFGIDICTIHPSLVKYRFHSVPTYLGESLVTSLGQGGALLASVQGTLQEVNIFRELQQTAQHCSHQTILLYTQVVQCTPSDLAILPYPGLEPGFYLVLR